MRLGRPTHAEGHGIPWKAGLKWEADMPKEHCSWKVRNAGCKGGRGGGEGVGGGRP